MTGTVKPGNSQEQSYDVMKVLMADVLAMVPHRQGNPLNDDGTPVWHNDKDMPNDETAEMRVF